MRREIRLELLEPRLALAGLVTAELNGGGSLIVRGDAEDNQIAIRLDEQQIVIASLDATTQINGQAEVRLDASLLQRDLRVNMKQGNDVVRIGGEAHETPAATLVLAEEDDHDEPRLSIPGSVSIMTGIGSDTVGVSFVQIGGGLFVNTMGDTDLLDAAEMFEGDLALATEEALLAASGTLTAEESEGDDTNEADDAVNVGRGPSFGAHGHGEEDDGGHTLAAASEPGSDSDGCGGQGGPPPDVEVGQEIFIVLGPGADAAKVAFTQVGESVRVLAGSGADYVITGRGPIHGEHGPGGGDDCGDMGGMSVTAEEEPGDGGHDPGDGGHQGKRPVDLRVGFDVHVQLGPGDDFAMLRNTKVGHDLIVAALPGNDSVGTQNVRVSGDTSIKTQAGTDFIALLTSEFGGALDISTGNEADVVVLDEVQVGGVFRIDLGTRDDTLVLSASKFLSSVTLDGGRNSDVLVLGVGEAANEFAVAPRQISYETLDPALIDEVLATVVERFGPFLQGRG
jgi:hypothetical protein